MAVVGLVLLLMVKYVVLVQLWLLSTESFFTVIFASLVIARTQALAWIVTVPYSPLVKTAGLGAILARCVPVSIAWIIVGVVMVLMMILLPLALFLSLLLILVLIHYLWRSYWIKQLKGFVGDSIGALIESVETIVLLCCYFSLVSVV